MSNLRDELYSLLTPGNKGFDFLQGIALDGMWFLNLENQEEEWMSEKLWAILGYDPAEMPHKPSALKKFIHPKDLKLSTNAFHRHLKDPTVPYDVVVRFIHKNGQMVWIRSRGMAIYNEEGRPYRMLGYNTDLTSQKRKELLLESCNSAAKIGFWEVDMEKEELTWSSETRKIHEIDDDFIIDIEKGISFYEEGWSRDTILKIYNEAIEDLQERDVELRLVTHKGNVRWVRSILVPVGDENGKCIKMYGTFQDIHDRKLAELRLDKERRKLAYILESTGLGTWQGAYLGGKTTISERFAEILGYKLEELPQKTQTLWEFLIHPDFAEDVDQKMRNCAEGRSEVFETNALLKHKSGKYLWVNLRAKYYDRIDGKGKLFYGTITDVDREHRQFLQQKSFIAQSPTPIALLDDKLQVLTTSEKWKELFKIEEDVEPGRAIRELLPSGFEELIGALQTCLTSNELQEGELEFVCKGRSTPCWIRWNFTPWYNKATKDGGVIMHVNDITEDKHLRMELEASESRFRGSFETAGVGTCLVDQKGNLHEVNEKMCDILGYSREELLQCSFSDITHPDDLEEEFALLKDLTSGKINKFRREKRYLNRDRGVVDSILAVSAIPATDIQEMTFVAQVVDITELKKVEAQLVEAVAKNEVILNASEHVVIVSSDLDGVIQNVNVGCERLLGYSRDELLDKKDITFFHNEEQIEVMENSFAQIFGNPMKAIDGIIALVKQQDGPITQELVYTTKKGNLLDMVLTVSPIKAEEKLIGFLGIAIDISDVKKAEQEIKDLLLISEDQNARLKNFAHIVSHNLRSHSGNIDFLMDLLIQDHPTLLEGEIVPMLKQASSNLKESITHLNEVAVINTTIQDKMHSIDLVKSVEHALSNVPALAMKQEVEIINEIQKPINVLAIHAYLDSILLNFITNGIKYSSPERKSWLKISAKEEKEFVVLTIADNGLGIDLKRHGKKLFGMYKTFHQHKDARGVGLFISKSQIEAIGGRVEVSSEVNKGTTFRIYLKHP